MEQIKCFATYSRSLSEQFTLCYIWSFVVDRERERGGSYCLPFLGVGRVGESCVTSVLSFYVEEALRDSIMSLGSEAVMQLASSRVAC